MRFARCQRHRLDDAVAKRQPITDNRQRANPEASMLERRRTWSPVIEQRDRVTPRPHNRTPELIVIGCSLGGMSALQIILSGLTHDFCVPIVIAQHRHKRSNEGLPAYFRRQTDLKVVDAQDKEWIRSGHVFLAPADYHLLIERNGSHGELNLS